MNWTDEGFLISKTRYNENSLIAELFTKDKGKISGIIFGGTSKKIKNYLQIGNQLSVNYNTKSENKIGFFKIEIEKVLSPLYFENSKKLSCIMSAMQLIKILTAESQKNVKIYDLIENFYEILKQPNWLKMYIYWELELLKNLGYDLEFENLVTINKIGNETQYITKSSNKIIVPKFLVNKNEQTEDFKTLMKGLKLVGDYLEKTILKPNNINQPVNRFNFINSLK